MTRLIISFRLNRVVFYTVIDGEKTHLDKEDMSYQRDYVYSDEKSRLARKYKLKFEAVENDYDDICKE